MAYQTTSQVRARLRAERKHRGWDVVRLAREMLAAMDESQRPTLTSMVRSIERWESGTNRGMSERYRLLYARVYGTSEKDLFDLAPQGPENRGEYMGDGAALEAVVVHRDVAELAVLRLPATLSESASLIAALARADLEDGRTFAEQPFDVAACSSAALRWLIAPRTALGPGDGDRGLGMEDVQEIREAVQAFRVLDNQMGASRIRRTVVDYLCVDVAPLLRSARCSEPVRRQLFSAAAELAQLCGWQAHDLELQALAQRYLVQALALARFAEDDRLGGEILAAMSQLAIYVRRPDEAIDMAQASQTAGDRTGLAVLEAEGLALEAHAHALRADATACSQALSRAETAFSRAGNADDVPPWLAYFDEAYFAARIAHCYRALGQGAQTERHAQRSLRMDPRYIRGKAFNTALLASGYAAQGEVEEACRYGRRAVDLTAKLGSARAVASIQGLLQDLAPYASTEQVTELRAYAAGRLPAPQRHAARP
ncbi:tetratricopeptide repeat protein [Thermomonospora amylolytica]|uniref:hypothetical protein n=1 Tax=Thermomonospora amylolytica TaxID=1411117 RepID=UPI000E6B63BF|nr:hypothetical protein [Thermomonospora amylolytica]